MAGGGQGHGMNSAQKSSLVVVKLPRVGLISGKTHSPSLAVDLKIDCN